MNGPLHAVGEVTPDSGSPVESPRAGVNAGMCWGLQLSDHEKQPSSARGHPRGHFSLAEDRLTPGDLLSRAKALGLISSRNNSGPSGGAVGGDLPAPQQSLLTAQPLGTA